MHYNCTVQPIIVPCASSSLKPIWRDEAFRLNKNYENHPPLYSAQMATKFQFQCDLIHCVNVLLPKQATLELNSETKEQTKYERRWLTSSRRLFSFCVLGPGAIKKNGLPFTHIKKKHSLCTRSSAVRFILVSCSCQPRSTSPPIIPVLSVNVNYMNL